MRWWKWLRMAGAWALLLLPVAVAHAVGPGRKVHTADMQWWKQARFGMFIHWGIYSQAAGYWHGKPIKGAGEWIMDKAHLTRQAYGTLAAKFDPVDFNADQWVKLARRAGMRYIVITAKHHDGFCMFRTKATSYNVVNDTPWHKDPLALLAAACRKYHIRFCTYYSIQDWHSRYTLPGIGEPNRGRPDWQPMRFVAHGGGEKYVKYVQRQVGELVRQYHPSLLWFDNNAVRSWVTPGGHRVLGWTRHDASQVFHAVRRLDPTVVINNRLGWGFGDYKTPEQHIPPRGLPGAWETCMTINWTWGYKRDDHHWKSPAVLITNLIKCASGGGNFLLNVGPTGKGIIPQPEVQRLLAIGRWMRRNGRAIYGSHRSPFTKALGFGYATEKPGKLFLEVTRWPHQRRILAPMRNKIKRVDVLGFPQMKVKVESGPHGQMMYLPRHAPEKVATVIAVTITGPLKPIQ